jgi:hypothetical protein
MYSKKRKQGLYGDPSFLKALELGSESAIAAARAQYYRTYKADWRKRQRRENQDFCVSLSDGEYRQLKAAAEKHKISTTRMIKLGALAYIAKKYLVSDVLAVGAIKQEITVAISLIRRLIDDNLLPFQLANKMALHIEAMEERILFDLCYPRTLEQYIQEAISENPEYRNKILTFLN